MTAADSRLARLASTQHGVFDVFQARQAGLSRGQVQGRLRASAWTQLQRGVYALASSPDTFERSLTAAILAHPRAIAAGEAAARIHGFRLYEGGRLEIMVPLTGNARTRGTYVIRSTFFNTVRRVTVNGITATSPAETVLTLSSRIRKARLEILVEEVFGRGLAEFTEFAEILDRCAGGRVKGVRNLRSVLASRDPDAEGLSESVLESALYRLLSQPGLPEFLPQHEIRLTTRTIRADAYLPDWRVVVEADGRAWHTRRHDFERDRQRDNELQGAGFRVCRFTFGDLTHDFEGSTRILRAFSQAPR